MDYVLPYDESNFELLQIMKKFIEIEIRRMRAETINKEDIPA